MGETLLFTLEEIYEVLGEAVADRLMGDLLWMKDDTMLVAGNFPEEQIEAVTRLCQRLHYLVPFENDKTHETGWRFVHLLLGVHFGLTFSLVRLRAVDSRVRRYAAAALDRIGWQPDTQVQKIAYVIAREDWNECVQIGEPAVEPLITYLQDASWDVRSSAADALGEIGDGRAIEPLIDCLHDTDSRVRRRAADALGRIGKQAVEPLIACLRDTDSRVRGSAADVLSKIGDQRAIEPLIDCLHDTHPNVRCCVANLLGQTGNDRTVKPLIVCLRDPDRWVRLRTATALARIGDERAVEPLIICLRDEYKGVQLNAAAALNTIATPQATAAVKAYDADRKNFDPEAFLAQWEADHPAE
jgi:HEAT repeat protein